MANQEEQINEDYLFKTKIRMRIRIDNTNFNEWVKWSIIGLYAIQIILAICFIYEIEPLEYCVLIIATIYFMVLSLGYVTTNSQQLKEKHMLTHQSMQSLLLIVLSINQTLYFIFQFSGTNLKNQHLTPLLFVNFGIILLFWVSAYLVFKTVYKYSMGDLKDILTLNQVAIAILLYGVWISIMSLKESSLVIVLILSLVVLLFIASWVKWIKKPSSSRVETITQARSHVLSSVAKAVKIPFVKKLVKDLVALSSLIVGVFTLAQFIYAFGDYDAKLDDLFYLLATSAVSFYIFTKLMISFNRDKNIFVYDNHFRDGSIWKIDRHQYRKYVSKRFRRAWLLNLIFAILLIISFSIYMDYENHEFNYEEKDFWSLMTLGIAILAVVSWILRYLRKYQYQEKMDQILGGLSLSGGALGFITEQKPELKSFASIEVINLINKGILERVYIEKDGE
ncbi:MAG: hypothetical protein ACTSYA_03910 [Candidatus Kariarchaeaceae archaeon]